MSEFRPEVLTWTALLARWVEYAQASVALPHDVEGERWRTSVPAIINLQAVTFALGDLTQLFSEDRPHARDLAAVMIRENSASLFEAWAGETLPPLVREMMDDADAALERAVFAGAVELFWPGPKPLVMPALDIDLARGGTLAVAQPGTIIMQGEPLLWWAERERQAVPPELDGVKSHEPELPRQVYREFDADRRIVRDIVMPVLTDPPPGEMMPLLVPLVQDGRRIGSFTMDAAEWEHLQRTAMTGETIPTEFHDSRA